MSWLSPLLDQIMYMNDRDEVENATRDYLQPIADQVGKDIDDPEERRNFIKAWWQKQLSAAVDLSVIRKTAKTSNIKLIQEINNVR
jgi:hypothetical protein